MRLQETILTTSGTASTINLNDLSTGVNLCSFKGFPAPSGASTSTSKNSIAVFESSAALGGYILGTNSEKGVLGVWNFHKEGIQTKIVLPTKLTCLAVDSRGDWCVGGTSEGRVYLWETASGVLWNVWDAHYRGVTVLRFTKDGNALLSGSEDSGIAVWMMSSLLSLNPNGLQLPPMPSSMLSDHTLPITDIQCGIGGFPKCRVLSSSLDCSVKLWDISPTTPMHLITTFLLPTPIQSIAWDVAERFFYASSSSISGSGPASSSKQQQQQQSGDGGCIYRMDLYSTKLLHDGTYKSNAGGFSVREAVGGQGSLDILRFSSETGQDGRGSRCILLPDEYPTTLALSLNGSQLLAGTSKGMVHVYDVKSGQRVRSLHVFKDSSITTLMTLVKPLDLIGHVTLSAFPTTTTNATVEGGVGGIPPSKVVLPFQRVVARGTGGGGVSNQPYSEEQHRIEAGGSRHEVSIILPDPLWLNHVEKDDFSFVFSNDGDGDGGVGVELEEEHRFFVGSQSSGDVGWIDSNAPTMEGDEGDGRQVSKEKKIQDLERQVESLKRELDKAKGINDKMWEGVVRGAIFGRNGKDEDM